MDITTASEPHYLILFRTCDVVHSLHNAPRPFGLDKRTLIKICFLSLYEAVQGYNYTIHILADKLSDELTAFFQRFPVQITHGSWGMTTRYGKVFGWQILQNPTIGCIFVRMIICIRPIHSKF